MDHADSRFIKACRREQVDCTPVWIMRQAGRYLPEYRELRKKHAMLKLCRTPELAAEVTLMPLKRFALDAAILFSDLTIPFYGMGVKFDLKENVGPVIAEPIKTLADIEKLHNFSAEEATPYVIESIKILKQELKVPLIGFAGAPFTLAAYLIEGKPTRDFKLVRSFMYSEPDAWRKLMALLTDVVADYLKAQAAAGANAVQVFDSWVGCLHPETYREYLFSHMRRLFESLKETGVPVIHFGTGTAALLPTMREAGGDVIGVDWRTSLAAAWAGLDYQVAVQGNLDPAVLLADRKTIAVNVERILKEAAGRAGHIFNLGHGIFPETDPDNLAYLVELVHELSKRSSD
ncbi:MAG: uroporphyrinogen decarboxylase [Candidatus Dadabacteria bacterium]|nr:MAG: uroporphyrinogen decarboxylase [Candidatus Dadabacteria bacterium]